MSRLHTSVALCALLLALPELARAQDPQPADAAPAATPPAPLPPVVIEKPVEPKARPKPRRDAGVRPQGGAKASPAAQPPQGAAPPPQNAAGQTQGGRSTITSQNSYTLPTASSATKTDLPLTQIPFTVDILTQALITDQGDANLEQGLRALNVLANDGTSGFGAKSYVIRGFDLYDNQFVNGVRAPDYPQLDEAVIDHVEVVKGAAAGVYGRIEAGGLINSVTLKPQATPAASISQMVGGYDDFRTVFDATGPVFRNSNLLYRLIIANEDSGSWRDEVNTDHLTIAPILQWNPTDHDEVDFFGQYKRQRDTTDWGIAPYPSAIDPVSGNVLANSIKGLPVSAYFGAAGAYNDRNEGDATLTWTHDFGNGWKIKPILSFYDYVQNGNDVGWNGDTPGPGGVYNGWINTPAAGWGAAQPSQFTPYVGTPSDFSGKAALAEVDLTGKVSGFGVPNTLFFSVERWWQDYSYKEWPSSNTTTYYDPFAPVYPGVPDFPTGYPDPSQSFGDTRTQTWWSWTAQDTIDITPHTHLIASVRFDYAWNSGTNWGFGLWPPSSNSEYEGSGPQPRLGLSQDILPWLVAYGSYAKGFGDSQLGTVLYNGKTAPSYTSQQEEVGFKGHWFDDKLFAEATFFNLTKNNVVEYFNDTTGANPFCPLGTCANTAGEIGSRGVELLLSGQLAPRWSTTVAYTYLNAKVLASGDTGSGNPLYNPIVGQPLAGVPNNSAAFWLEYSDPRGWKIGGGGNWVGPRPFDAPAYQFAPTITLPAYLSLDVAASYEFKGPLARWTAQLKLVNLTNTPGWQLGYNAIGASSGLLPIEPRTVQFTLKASI